MASLEIRISNDHLFPPKSLSFNWLKRPLIGVESCDGESILGSFVGDLSALQRAFILLGDELISCQQFVHVRLNLGAVQVGQFDMMAKVVICCMLDGGV
jgi:hypothetical protein